MTTDENKNAGVATDSAQAAGSVPSCKFCTNESMLKSGCAKQRHEVCQDHFMVECPECGHEAFWVVTTMHPKGRFCCFAVDPWCDWVSEIPPNDQHDFPGK